MTGTTTKPSDRNVLLGPWGGDDGARWMYTGIGPITHISITSDADAIRSISFGEKSPVFGTSTGPANEISIDPDVEKLILMEGIVGTYYFVDDFVERVTQLSFTTSKNGVTTKHGPYGSQKQGIEFSCLLSENPFMGFYGRSSELLNSIGVVVKSKDDSQSWGGEGGSPWSYTPKGTISHIYVCYDDVIRAIRFTSIDVSGRVKHSKTFGHSDPKHKYHEIKIDLTGDKLNGIMGTYGTSGNATVIRSLAFTTQQHKTFGTYGKRTGIPFKFVNNNEEVIAGFFGRSGSSIDAIGVRKRKVIASTNAVFVGPVGISSPINWTYQPKGLISSIILTYRNEAYVYAIAFESRDESGRIDRSPILGRLLTTGNPTREINIKGKLNGIGGTVLTLSDGVTLISSLYFTTDEKVMYGPFGNQNRGTHFSIPVKDGFISGLQGTSPETENYYFIQSLGVYANCT